MENQLEKRYGLPTAIAMVIGTVIGSGVFFKAVSVLKFTGGNMAQSLMVIGIVGCICIVCSSVFATMGTKYVKCNGVVDYAEVALGRKYAYYVGWFMSCLYYPILSATLAYISARYTCILLGLPEFGQANASIGVLYLGFGIGINSLAPKLAAKTQISTTVIKLIPLLVMGIFGTIYGLSNGNSIRIFNDPSTLNMESSGIFAAITSFTFAYEGWIIATTINSELKNPKRDLPLALMLGAFVCTAIYMLYTYSMSATMNAAEILEAGNNLPRVAFTRLFNSPAAGTIVMVLIIISCLGTTNGLILGTMRGFYSIAIRGHGPMADSMVEVDKKTGMPLKSCIVGMTLCMFWYWQTSMLFFNGPLVLNTSGNPAWLMAWEGDEIAIITLYAFYIPIFLYLMIKEKEFSFVQRYVMTGLGLCACVFLCYSCWQAYRIQVLYYLIIFGIFMAVGAYFYDSPARKQKKLQQE